MVAYEEAIALHEESLEALAAGRLAEAGSAARRALAIFEVEDGPDSPDVANLSNHMAEILEAAGDYREIGRASCRERV